MKLETKQYKYLKRLVGKDIIRIKPCKCKYGTDYSYTDEPVRVVSISKEKFVFEKKRTANQYEKDTKWMSEWLDGNWYSVEDAMRFPKTKLNKLKGKMIRLKLDQFSFGYENGLFLDKPVKLIMATKYHLLVNRNGKEWWLDNRQTAPNDWQEA